MANGGPDNCSNCTHNRAVHEVEAGDLAGLEEFMRRSWCSLRDVNIDRPHWTYCANAASHPPAEACEPKGWIKSSGLYEGYVRIPWHGWVEPLIEVPASCHVCQRETEQGITIDDEGQTLGFCTNRHYVEWWKTRHDDPDLDPEAFETPEERFDQK